MVNTDKPHLWKADVAQSVDFYNDWFMRFAPRLDAQKTQEERNKRGQFATPGVLALEMANYAYQLIDVNVLQSNGCTYGGGLQKLAPKELANVPLKGLPTKLFRKQPVQYTLF